MCHTNFHQLDLLTSESWCMFAVSLNFYFRTPNLRKLLQKKSINKISSTPSCASIIRHSNIFQVNSPNTCEKMLAGKRWTISFMGVNGIIRQNSKQLSIFAVKTQVSKFLWQPPTISLLSVARISAIVANLLRLFSDWNE